jgi:hypothetical protein
MVGKSPTGLAWRVAATADVVTGSQMQASPSGHAPVPSCLGSPLPLGEGHGARRESLAPRGRCGNGAPWKSLCQASIVASGNSDFSTVPTALGNRAKTKARNFHIPTATTTVLTSWLQGRRTAFGGELYNRGWLSRGKILWPVEGEAFLLTSPFIKPLS